MNLQEFETLLQEIFPIRSTHASLELVSTSLGEGKAPSLLIIARLFTFEAGSIRNIKEQELRVGPEAILEWHQLEIYFRGYALALNEVFEKISLEKVDCCMPHDVFPRHFELKKAQTSVDYQKAFLLKSRLGKFLL